MGKSWAISNLMSEAAALNSLCYLPGVKNSSESSSQDRQSFLVSRSNATTSRWQLLHSIYEQVPGIALPTPPHEGNGDKWALGETSRHLQHWSQVLQRKANQLQPTWEMAELVSSLAMRGGAMTKISEMQRAGKTAAELCSQWLWISHVTWCKQTISLQCIYLKPGDLRDCCCGYWFSSHSSDVLRANNPISHERKKDLQERPPAVTIQSKVPLNFMFHHAADSK